MIPKIVHYVWVGGPKPDSVRKNIDNWKHVLSDYSFKEWNEENWDISKNLFANYFYDRGKFGFVGDPIRVDVLKRFGGIYLDTDVEVYKPFDPLLGEKLVFSRIYNNALGTATILAEKNNAVISDLAEIYNTFSLEKLEDSSVDKVSNGVFTRYFLDKHTGFSFGNSKQRLKNGVLILPKQFFEIPAMWFEGGSFAMHDAVGSWQDKLEQPDNIKAKIKVSVRKLFPAITARYENYKIGMSNSIAKEYGSKTPK